VYRSAGKECSRDLYGRGEVRKVGEGGGWDGGIDARQDIISARYIWK
jgi:hypothetical protein